MTLLRRSCRIGAVASPPVVRSAKPAWADPEAAGSAGSCSWPPSFSRYLPALGGGFLWDDDAHVTKAGLRSLHGLWRIWFEPGATQQYYPVLHSAFWIEHRLWGDSVLGYHLANAALHAAAAWLLVAHPAPALRSRAPVLAGLLFALHPVCVESVAWISEQKNTLSAVFYLGRRACLPALRRDAPQERLRVRVRALRPCPADEDRDRHPAGGPPRGFLVAPGPARLAARRGAAPAMAFRRGRVRPLHRVGREEADRRRGRRLSLTALQRALLAGRAVVFYASKVVWPANLTFIYPRWTIDPRDAGAYLYPIAVLALLGALALLARRRRGPACGPPLLCRDAFPGRGLRQRLPVPVLVCRGPLPVPGLHRDHRARSLVPRPGRLRDPGWRAGPGPACCWPRLRRLEPCRGGSAGSTATRTLSTAPPLPGTPRPGSPTTIWLSCWAGTRTGSRRPFPSTRPRSG